MSGARAGFDGPRHHRRARRRDRRIIGRRSTIILVAAAATLLGATGYSVGAFLIGTFASAPAQSAAAGAPEAPPGVTYPLVQAEVVNATTVPATGACVTSNLGNQSSPTTLTNGTATGICLTTAPGGFGAADFAYIFEVSWNHTALPSTLFKVQLGIDVAPATNDIVATAYLETSATIVSSESAIFAIDLTEAGDTGVTSYSILITQL